jgi:hypothetical protein
MSDEKWFKHDSNAKDDPKIVYLIEQLGLEGYGIFWVLIETLREQNDFSYPVKLVPSIARKYMTSAEKIVTVIKNYRLFDVFEKDDGDYFFSLSLNNRMAKYKEISEKRKIAGHKGGIVKQLLSKNQAIAKQPESNCQANRIEENRIEENRRYNLTSSKEEDVTPKNGVTPANFNPDKFIAYWNGKTRLKKIQKLTEKRIRSISQRIKEHGKDSLVLVVDKTNDSDFLAGTNDRNWSANLDWVINPTNYVKIIEGYYDNANAKKKKLTYEEIWK